MESLADRFGNIDIYLFDQLLKGRIDPRHRILDAGCGGGRNLVWLVGQGARPYAVDRDPERIAGLLDSGFDTDRASVAELDHLPFDEASFDVVLCNAVLHFARDPGHFEAMVRELGRVLAPGGLFFARLASSIGIEDDIHPLGSRRYNLPDGSDRFLVDVSLLEEATRWLEAELVDPIKTTNVGGLRCMTTWVARRRGA